VQGPSAQKVANRITTVNEVLRAFRDCAKPAFVERMQIAMSVPFAQNQEQNAPRDAAAT
jgi:hypothetical protein